MPATPWIVLPTYDEAENIEAMIAAVLPIMREACGRDGFRVLIVDDNSPDGTGAIADRLAADDAQVSVLHRTGRRGLGPAYVAGFDHALGRGVDQAACGGRHYGWLWDGHVLS